MKWIQTAAFWLAVAVGLLFVAAIAVMAGITIQGKMTGGRTFWQAVGELLRELAGRG
jgi:hypothetical protein